MELSELQELMLRKYNLRIVPAMAQYMIDHMNSKEPGKLPIIAGDAKTGLPVRQIISLDELLTPSSRYSGERVGERR
jgi:hypothetical protein